MTYKEVTIDAFFLRRAQLTSKHGQPKRRTATPHCLAFRLLRLFFTECALFGKHGGDLRAAHALAQLCRCRSMASQAQGANVIQVALAPAFADGENVIRIPKTFPYSAIQPPMPHKTGAPVAARPLESYVLRQRIHSTVGAHATVAPQYLVPQIARLRSQFPFVHAIIRAEGETPRRNLERAPAAQTSAVGSARNVLAIHPSSGHRSTGAHENVCNALCPLSVSVSKGPIMPVCTPPW